MGWPHIPESETFIIKEIREEAAEVKTFFLQPASGREVRYLAGQFISFSFLFSGKEERRSYSFSTTPVIDSRIAITVKRVANGAFSRFLIDQAKVGDPLTSTGISGMFTLPDSVTHYERILLFAAGVGITPLFSILKSILYNQPAIQVVLIYSNRSQQNAVFLNDLQQLERQFPDQLTIEWLFSDHKNLARARLSRPLLSQLMKQQLAKTPADRVLSYLCGPADYMWMVQLLLEENGLDNKQIRRELFITERPPILQTPPDHEAHHVTIHLRGQIFEINVQYPETILSVAKKAGIPIPYSCEAGRCSSCVAMCKKGEVWMAYNEVLTDDDIAKGLALTCVGYPVGDDVTISY